MSSGLFSARGSDHTERIVVQYFASYLAPRSLLPAIVVQHMCDLGLMIWVWFCWLGMRFFGAASRNQKDPALGGWFTWAKGGIA
jgi:hypothetical protein